MENGKYDVQELFSILKNDESWESDPEMRELIIMMLSYSLAFS